MKRFFPACPFAEGRRRFLGQSAGYTGALLTLGHLGSLTRIAFASPDVPKPNLLVILFLRGGADGLQFCAPVHDPDYIAARPPELRVLADGTKAGLPVPNTHLKDSKGLDFRLHCKATGLHDLMKAGQLAVIHAAGLTHETRSHFEAEELIERGLATFSELSSGASGWLARVLADSTHEPLAAVTLGNRNDLALAGLPRVLALSDLQRGLTLAGGDSLVDVLASLNGDSTSAAAVAGRNFTESLQLLRAKLPPTTPITPPSSPVPNTACYDASELGQGLRNLAALIKSDVPLRAACLNMAGWDTHENQPGRFDALVNTLSSNLAAFWGDLDARRNQVTLIALSEFGRRLRSNKSGGTDHGHGGAMFLLSDKLRRGGLFGVWPGLERDKLDRYVDLAVTIDWRRVVAEVLTSRFAVHHEQLGSIFPHLGSVAPIGLFEPA